MKKKIHLYLITGLAVLILINIAIAYVPPPPANQDIGIYDTNFTDFTEPECRECHSSGLPDKHHMLAFNGEYECIDCHPPDFGNGNAVTVIRDCMNSSCHISTPQHVTDAAIYRHCSECHGSFVDDFDDEHYIPSYNISLVTPDTSYRIINETTGKKWGGCEACHEPNHTAVPVIESNPNTHHNAVYDITCSTGGLGNICHFDPVANIRKCEDCHSVRSLHNIQYDYDNTNGQLGYGHIGANWDCLGCHAWFEPTKSSGPEYNVIPVIERLSEGSIEAGMSTKIDIMGNNFVNTINGTTYSSEVILVNGDDEITLESDVISSSMIEVRIPSLDAGSCGIYLLKGNMTSKLMPFVVGIPVTIDSAVIGGNRVIITGSGFNETLNEKFADWLGVDIEDEAFGSEVFSWSDKMIILDNVDANIGDNVTVNALFGSDSIELVPGSYGDVNCDSEVDITDVIGLYYNVAGIGNDPLIFPWAGDVNCEDGIDITDVILLYYNVTYNPTPDYLLKCCE